MLMAQQTEHKQITGSQSSTKHPHAAKLRLIRLADAIRSAEGSSPAALARRFGVGSRTIERDIQVLKDAGVDVGYDRKTRRYRIHGERFLAPVDFTADEAMALLLLARHIDDDPVLARPAARAMAKLRSQLPSAMGEALEPMNRHISIRSVGGESPGADTDAYCKMQKAIADQCELACRYEAAHSDDGQVRRPFNLRPYHLLFSARAWYVIGHCSDRKAIRTLKLIRFETIQETGQKFIIPKTFSIANYLGKCWRMIPGSPRRRIRLHIGRKFAPGLCETQWHSTQMSDPQPDGSVMMEFTVDGLDEIIWWILALGPECKVIESVELATKVRDLARLTTGLYGG